MTPCCLRGAPAPRLLIVPGLRDSGPAHWQTWLEAQHKSAVRVVQHRWDVPDVDRWAARIASTVERAGAGPWVVAAHSFGVLALARHLQLQPASPVRAVLLVAPADPSRWGLGEQLPQRGLGRPATLVASETDPWIKLSEVQRWARRWQASLVNLGDAGHINAESGFGPFPLARQWVQASLQRLLAQRRADEPGLPAHAATERSRGSIGEMLRSPH